jgi:hypothetical protein
LADLTLTVVAPVATPMILTWLLDTVCPAAIVMLDCDSVAFVGSLLVRLRNIRDAAGFAKLIG